MKVFKTKNQLFVQLKKSYFFTGTNIKIKVITESSSLTSLQVFSLLTSFHLKTKKNNFLSIFFTKKIN